MGGHFIRLQKKTFFREKMIISEILRNEAFQEQMRKAAENQKKQYDFDKDPFRVRSSRPEPTTNLYGEPVQYYSRTHKKSVQHRFFEKMGWLSSDPTVRMAQNIRYQRIFKVTTVVLLTASMIYTSQPNFDPEESQEKKLNS